MFALITSGKEPLRTTCHQMNAGSSFDLGIPATTQMATKIKFCPECGSSVSSEASFCQSCGFGVGRPSGEDTTDLDSQSVEEELEALLRANLAGEYDIAGLLGVGGMAIVYEAYDIMLGREVAIKVLPPQLTFGREMVERFKREARTSAQLNHPNIIPIYRIGQLDRTVYFVMKYVDGRSLEEILEEHERLSVAVVSSILQHVCGALTYAHKRGVIHRDIKPSNIMLDDEGWVLVMDFGIAKATGSTSLTATGAAIGTPHYMSPEQCSGKNVTPLSDQYSLAVMAYQMISGSVPFHGETLPEIIAQHCFDDPPPLGDAAGKCPSRIADAVHRALAKAPEDRFPSLKGFVAAFAEHAKWDSELIRGQMSTLAKESTPRVQTLPPASPIPASRSPGAHLPLETTAEESEDATTKPIPAAPRRRSAKSMIAAMSVMVGVVAVIFLGLGNQAQLYRWLSRLGGSTTSALPTNNGIDSRNVIDSVSSVSDAVQDPNGRETEGSAAQQMPAAPPARPTAGRQPGISTSRAGAIPEDETAVRLLHPLCRVSRRAAEAAAGTAAAALILRNCVDSITVLVRGRPWSEVDVSANRELRIAVGAPGYRTLRVDTVLTPGTVLVLSGALERRD